MKMRMLTRMMLFVLLPSFLGLISLTVISDNLASKSLRKQIVDDLNLLAQVQARELDNVVALLRSTSLNLANTAHVIEYLEAVESKNADITGFQTEAKETLDSMVKQYARIQAAGILGLDGKMLAHTNPAVQGQDVSARGYYLDSVKQGKTTVFTSYSDVVKNFICLIATPVKLNGKIIGAALIDVDLTALAASTTEQVRIARTGFCYFLTPDGKIISHPDKTQVGKDLSGQGWMQDIMKSPKGYISYTFQDVAKVAFYAHVTNTDWPVVISVETDDLLSSIADMNRTILIVALSIIALVGCIIFFISKGMATVLRGSADMARFVADGNLTLTPEYTAKMDKNCRRTDEIGDLSKAMQAMIANLGELFTSSTRKTQEAEQATAKAAEAQKQAEEAARQAERAKRDGMLAAAEQLEGAVQIITSASTQLSAQIEQSERGASEQAARMTETATAMEEMNSTVLEVAKNAGSAADISASTRHKAEAGADVVRKSLKSIQDVQQQSLRLRTDMGKLDENAQAINQIMSVISDIADQTNLLALNAAIEAARAGEAGRGFAVVADEVRKLAEKTMASTTDVGNAIRAIQQSATDSMAQVDHSVTFIEEATNYASLSGKALDEIVSMVDTTADQVRAIAAASEQQSSTSDEINNSITMVNGIASDTARAMNEAARAVNNLADQAGVLTRLIENMKQS